MNQITAAFKKAGVTQPALLQRVWQWLHDKGGHYTAKEIAKALGAEQVRVASVLTDGFNRVMLSRQQSTRKVSHGNAQWEWAAVGKAYELLPRRKKVKLKAPVAVTPPPAIKLYDGPTPVPNIDAMTVREARALYNQLHKMFGPTS